MEIREEVRIEQKVERPNLEGPKMEKLEAERSKINGPEAESSKAGEAKSET